MVPGTVESKARKIVWKRCGLVIVTHYSFSLVMGAGVIGTMLNGDHA